MSELCSVPRVSERFAQSNALDEDIARLKYVSGKREEALRRLGIRTVGDLLLHIPHRYLDFTRSWSIEMAPIGTVCTIIATVDRIVQKQPRPRMQVTEVSLVDETGVLQVAFFRQPWIAQQLKQGDRLAVMGKVEFAYGFKQMASPHLEKLEGGRAAGTILPVNTAHTGRLASYVGNDAETYVNLNYLVFPGNGEYTWYDYVNQTSVEVKFDGTTLTENGTPADNWTLRGETP